MIVSAEAYLLFFVVAVGLLWMENRWHLFIGRNDLELDCVHFSLCVFIDGCCTYWPTCLFDKKEYNNALIHDGKKDKQIVPSTSQ
jgi:hypothetical protein